MVAAQAGRSEAVRALLAILAAGEGRGCRKPQASHLQDKGVER
jgi:hypothetical protein